MKRPVVVAVAVVVVLAGSVAGWLLLRDDGDGAGGRRPPEARAEAVRTTEPVAVSVTSGTPATFSWDGDEHQVTLVETDGSSARLSFASDEPLSVNLSTRTPTAVDLTADTVPDAVVTLTAVDGETADLSIASTVPATWNESGFTTAGGVRPYRHTGNSADEDHAVVPLDDGYLLLYVSADHKLNWERYDATGAQVTDPGLAVGVVETDPPGGRVTSVDAALLPGCACTIPRPWPAARRCWWAGPSSTPWSLPATGPAPAVPRAMAMRWRGGWWPVAIPTTPRPPMACRGWWSPRWWWTVTASASAAKRR